MSESTDLAVVDARSMVPTEQPTLSVSLLPVAQMEIVLDEYDARRASFRGWLLRHLQQGVHYGVPPGCEVKLDADGNILAWAKGGGTKMVPKEQWRARPSLYKAGAQLLCDLLKMRAEFTSDKAMWEMMGSKPGMGVTRCRLLYSGGPFFTDKAIGDFIGEGIGAFEVGEKGMNANSALKMSAKRAMVDAVINALGIADLFTQDLEQGAPDKRDAPTPEPDAPKVQPRADRPATGIGGKLALLSRKWATKFNEGVRDDKGFAIWAQKTLRTEADLSKPSAWDLDAVAAIESELP